MRVSNIIKIAALLTASAFCAGGSVFGLPLSTSDRETTPPANHARLALDKDYIDSGMIALQRAASEGKLDALLQLGKLYESADFAPQDSARACETYILITERFRKFDRFYHDAGKLVVAFRKAADCYVSGIGTQGSGPDYNMAGDVLLHSGVTLDDAESLFKLGKLFMAGEGIEPNISMATRFLENAARKQFPPAQALLGSMMWEGKVTKHRPAAGLALLILGMERTSSKDRAWISSLYDEAIITASKDVEREAMALVDKWKAVHGMPGGGVDLNSAPAESRIAVPTPPKSPTHGLDAEDRRVVGQDRNITDATTGSHSPASADALPNQ